MNCSDTQSNLSLYADGFLGDVDSVRIKSHLEACPLCRQMYAELYEIKAGLRQMRRPEISLALKNAIKESVRMEIRVEKQSWLPVSSDIREWLQMRVMPYGVGVFASLLIGVTFLTMMFSGMLKSGRFQPGDDSPVMLASNSDPYRTLKSTDISPAELVQSRLGFADESPSVNPQGALVALTKSLVRGGMKDDEVVVVADVFGNGLAQISEVVEPSHNQRVIGELQRAMESDPSFAPFVPSTLESRPDSVRVVLKFQSVSVNTRSKYDRRQL